MSAETILRDVVLAPVDKWNGQSKGRVTKVMHRYGWTKHRPRCGPKEAPEDSNSERHARADVYYPPVDARRLNPNDDTAGRPGVGDDEVGNNV